MVLLLSPLAGVSRHASKYRVGDAVYVAQPLDPQTDVNQAVAMAVNATKVAENSTPIVCRC